MHTNIRLSGMFLASFLTCGKKITRRFIAAVEEFFNCSNCEKVRISVFDDHICEQSQHIGYFRQYPDKL
jgi:hypothetical protein